MDKKTAIALIASIALFVSAGCSDDVNGVPAVDGSSSKDDSQAPDAVIADGGNHDAALRCASPDRKCFVGEAFADCGDPPAGHGPKVFCSQTQASCRWVSDGCPITGYAGPYDAQCRCTGGDCPSGLGPQKLMMTWGTSPWTRQRAADLTVVSGTGAAGTTVGSFTCDPLPSPWDTPYSPCKGTGAVVVRRPGTLVYEIEPKTPSLVYTTLVIEVDEGVSPATGRVCMIYYSDLASCSGGFPPLCATSGEVTVVAQGGQRSISRVQAIFTGGAKIDVAF